MKKGPAFFLALSLTLLLAINILAFPALIPKEYQTVTVQRVIDGDTLVTSDGETLRLENINTPERNKPGYEEAKLFLAQFENTKISIDRADYDKYGRTLAKIYTSGYLNLEIVKLGLAKKYLVDTPELKIFLEAEQSAIDNQLGLWKKSPFFTCLTSEIDFKKEIILLKNHCPEINLRDFTLSDESRKEFKLPSIMIGEVKIHTTLGTNNEEEIFLNSKTPIWENDRDTLYIFDSQNNLVHYHPYGYT